MSSNRSHIKSTTLAEKWHLVSKLYHDESELEAYIKLLQKIEAREVLDCACGTGFPCIDLAKRGFGMAASDLDVENLKLLGEGMMAEGVNIPFRNVPWFKLNTKLFGKHFDAVLCLGSSITYFESWNEDIRQLPSGRHAILPSLEGFRMITKPGGYVLIGVCKLYQKGRDMIAVDDFPLKSIDGKTYSMKWTLIYDWDNGIKEWDCTVYADSVRVVSLNLISHLYDKEDIKSYCEGVFSNVEEYDWCPKPYHDIVLLCRV